MVTLRMRITCRRCGFIFPEREVPKKPKLFICRCGEVLTFKPRKSYQLKLSLDGLGGGSR